MAELRTVGSQLDLAGEEGELRDDVGLDEGVLLHVRLAVQATQARVGKQSTSVCHGQRG